MCRNMAERLFCFCSFSLVLFASVASGVVTNVLPQIQAVYGGSIHAIDIIEPVETTNIARIFVSTESSANSIFYADVDHSLDPADKFSTNNFRFRVVPDFNAQANFGTVSGIAGHEDSGRLFVADNIGLLSCMTNAGSLVTNISLSANPGSQFLAVAIHESTLVGLASVNNSIVLYFGALDSDGKFTPGAGSPVNVGLSGISSGSDVGLAVNPDNSYVYVFDCSGAHGILKSSAPCASLSGATTFSAISLPAEASSWPGNKRLGFGPDGRMFVGGSSAGNFKMVAYSDNDGGAWTVVSTGVGGTVGNNINASHQTNLYGVIFGGAVSTNKGETGSWFSIGTGGGPMQTHANDSAAFYDPVLDRRSFYCSSDQGIACSTNGGATIFEIDYGLEAVAIQDLDMNEAKTLAWTASKSGLRRGAGEPMALTWTPDGTFPTGDGSPYYSIVIDQDDAAGNTVYAGNGNIYKTTDGGTNWTRIWANEGNTNGLPSSGYFASLAANGQTVVAGFYSGTGVGGLLVSQNGGSNWEQAISSMDVNDVLLLSNNSVLVAAAYSATTGAGGIYNQSASGRVHELTDNVSIRSFAPDSFDGVYACGQTPDYAMKIYYKSLADSSWTAVTTNGLPAQQQLVSGRGPVMTVGRDSSSNDLPIIIVGHSLYYLKSGESMWKTSSALTYPDGSQINVLFWDELMVGTSEGIYGQNIVTSSDTNRMMASVAVAGDFDGDRLADPAVYNTNGNWKIKLSSGGYSLLPLSGFLGGSGATALAADFDGDAKADPAVYYGASELWAVKLSSLNYLAPTVITGFGGISWEALAGDFDGDQLADPALYEAATGDWQVKLSTAGYATITKPNLLGLTGADWTAIAADFDGDRKVDPAIYNASTGSWIVMLSRSNYMLAVLEAGFLGSTGYSGLGADFDGDRLADPVICETITGHWQLRLSSGGYNLLDLPNFLGE